VQRESDMPPIYSMQKWHNGTHIQFMQSLGKEFGKPLIYTQHCRNGNWICAQFSVNR